MTDKYYTSVWFFPLLALVTLGTCALIMQPWKKKEPLPCSHYANWAMQDVPARCIKEFQR